jgi:hypothetical protein
MEREPNLTVQPDRLEKAQALTSTDSIGVGAARRCALKFVRILRLHFTIALMLC